MRKSVTLLKNSRTSMTRAQAARGSMIRDEMRVGPSCASCKLQKDFSFHPKKQWGVMKDFKQESDLVPFAFQKEQAG